MPELHGRLSINNIGIYISAGWIPDSGDDFTAEGWVPDTADDFVAPNGDSVSWRSDQEWTPDQPQDFQPVEWNIDDPATWNVATVDFQPSAWNPEQGGYFNAPQDMNDDPQEISRDSYPETSRLGRSRTGIESNGEIRPTQQQTGDKDTSLTDWKPDSGENFRISEVQPQANVWQPDTPEQFKTDNWRTNPSAEDKAKSSRSIQAMTSHPDGPNSKLTRPSLPLNGSQRMQNVPPLSAPTQSQAFQASAAHSRKSAGQPETEMTTMSSRPTALAHQHESLDREAYMNVSPPAVAHERLPDKSQIPTSKIARPSYTDGVTSQSVSISKNMLPSFKSAEWFPDEDQSRHSQSVTQPMKANLPRLSIPTILSTHSCPRDSQGATGDLNTDAPRQQTPNEANKNDRRSSVVLHTQSKESSPPQSEAQCQRPSGISASSGRQSTLANSKPAGQNDRIIARVSLNATDQSHHAEPYRISQSLPQYDHVKTKIDTGRPLQSRVSKMESTKTFADDHQSNQVQTSSTPSALHFGSKSSQILDQNAVLSAHSQRSSSHAEALGQHTIMHKNRDSLHSTEQNEADSDWKRDQKQDQQISARLPSMPEGDSKTEEHSSHSWQQDKSKQSQNLGYSGHAECEFEKDNSNPTDKNLRSRLGTCQLESAQAEDHSTQRRVSFMPAGSSSSETLVRQARNDASKAPEINYVKGEVPSPDSIFKIE